MLKILKSPKILMDKLNKILMASLAKKGLGRIARSSLACFYAKAWGKDRFEPISFSRGVLKVSVSSSPAASELQIEEEKMIDFVNKKIGKEIVRSVRIIVS